MFFNHLFLLYYLPDGKLDVSQSFQIEVLPVNDAPTVDSQEYSMDEDGSITIVLSGDDVDFDPLTYSIFENLQK